MTFILIICLTACICMTANQVSRSFTLDCQTANAKWLKVWYCHHYVLYTNISWNCKKTKTSTMAYTVCPLAS